MAKQPTQKNDNWFDYVSGIINAQPAGRPPQPTGITIDIEQEVAREKKISNDNAQQDIVLKRQTLSRLFRFLAAETVVIFAMTIAQGLRLFGFHLEEWSFNILVGATLTQIAVMLGVAVRYLFPKR